MNRRWQAQGRQGGYSLVELLIAMAMGLVLLATILSIYLGTSLANRQSDTVTRMSEDASLALETLARHIRMAGFSNPRLMVGRNTTNAGGQAAQINDSNFAGAGIKGCDGGFQSHTLPWDRLACNATTTGPDAIAIRYEGDNFNTEPAGSENASDCLGQGVAKNTNSAVFASEQFALIDSRFLVEDGQLKCAGNGNVNFQAQALVNGVEFLRLRYGLASDSAESQIKRYEDAAGVNALSNDADQNWGRVVAVRICIQMVGPYPDQSKAIAYTDCDGKLTTPDDKLLHRAFTTTVTLRNRMGIAQ